MARHLAVTVASVATVAPPGVPPGRRFDASRLGGGGPAPRPGESGAFLRKMGIEQKENRDLNGILNGFHQFGNLSSMIFP